MLGPNVSDSRIVVASQGGDLMSRMARINENKDFVKLSRRQGMHSGFGGMRPSILLIFIHRHCLFVFFCLPHCLQTISQDNIIAFHLLHRFANKLLQ